MPAPLVEALRTPDDRFADLPGWTFEPHYVEVDGLRVHYVDEGPPTAAPVLLLHGEPSWGYLYRKMIPLLVGSGHRVVAPDLIGFGRSDKPVRRDAYTYQRHVDWMAAVLMKLDLRDVTLVAQDWGGLIGLRLVAEHPARFARVVAANTFLPTGDRPLGPAFDAWRQLLAGDARVPRRQHRAGRLCDAAAPPRSSPRTTRPSPTTATRPARARFPMLVPGSPDDPAAAPNRRAWGYLRRFEKPFLTAFSDSDPITRGADHVLREMIPGARGQPHTTIVGGGHFLQEDRGEELAGVTVDFIARTR
jgi:haloalkane dehalogenase